MRKNPAVRLQAVCAIAGCLSCGIALSQAVQPASRDAGPSFPKAVSILDSPTAAAWSPPAQEQGSDASHDTGEAPNHGKGISQSEREAAWQALRRGMKQGETGDFSNAVLSFRQALKIWPRFAEAHYNLGIALIGASGNIPAWKEALAEFNAALAVRPDYAQALRMAGVCLLESGQTDQAIPRLRAALGSDPGSAETHFALGRALRAAGNNSEAGSEFEAALREKHPYPEADSALGTLLLEQGQTQDAAQHFRAALLANPDLESAHYGLATAYKREGAKAEAAIELKQASMLLERHSDAIMSSHLSNESLNRARTGDIAGAIELARKAVWLDPADAIANFNLGLLLADAGDLQATVHQLRKAISLQPSKSVFYLNLAKVQAKAGDSAAAAATIRQALQMAPENADLQRELSDLVTDKPSAAMRTLSAAKNAFPYGSSSETPDGHFAFATALSKEGDFVGAIGEMLRALVLDPTRTDIRYSLAVALTQIGQYDRAELELRTVLRLSPDSVRAHLALGSLLFQSNDLKSAAAELRQALVLDPGNQQGAQLLQQCLRTPGGTHGNRAH